MQLRASSAGPASRSRPWAIANLHLGIVMILQEVARSCFQLYACPTIVSSPLYVDGSHAILNLHGSGDGVVSRCLGLSVLEKRIACSSHATTSAMNM
jgi:hypothetical protein